MKRSHSSYNDGIVACENLIKELIYGNESDMIQSEYDHYMDILCYYYDGEYYNGFQDYYAFFIKNKDYLIENIKENYKEI